MSRNKYLSKTNYCCQTLSRNSFVFTLDKLIFTRKYHNDKRIFIYIVKRFDLIDELKQKRRESSDEIKEIPRDILF